MPLDDSRVLRLSLSLRPDHKGFGLIKRDGAYAAKTAIVGEKAGIGIPCLLPLAEADTAHLQGGFPGTSSHGSFGLFG